MSAYLRTLLNLYKPETTVKKFLSSFFITEDKNIFEGRKVRIDVVRGKQEYAVTIKYGTGSRKNTLEKWTGREFEVPAYHESVPITGIDLDKVSAGVSQYDLSKNYQTVLSDLTTDAVRMLVDKIERGIEVMCRDALFTGKIQVFGGDEIDFEVKATHFYTTPVAWTNSSADPFDDFNEIGNRVLSDSGRPIMDAICGDTALSKFLNNDNVKAAATFRQIERANLESPVADPESGAIYNGTINTSNYKINIWKFPESIDVPIGFGFPNEGTRVQLIPTDRIAVLPMKPNFRKYYAGNSVIKKLDERIKEQLGIEMGPMMQRGEIQKYAYLDESKEAVIIGVKSAPLPVLVDKEELGVIIVT